MTTPAGDADRPRPELPVAAWTLPATDSEHLPVAATLKP
ncbi:hypothetical protein JOF35_004645 [Streptomyces demainii]|uniref:Endonuclease/exonuclease/phosphatase family protein n=1 Tax=Streptomyces demainii TaxID=588122 RepID=A0ABT9KVA8_9ACTN|nr:hypothetical protein [Streptomyces demainii]